MFYSTATPRADAIEDVNVVRWVALNKAYRHGQDHWLGKWTDDTVEATFRSRAGAVFNFPEDQRDQQVRVGVGDLS